MADEPIDYEALAKILAQSPNHRVLKRLSPSNAFGTVPPDTLQHGIIIDTETTGLDPEADGLIEIALLRFSFDAATGLIHEVVESYGALEDCGQPIPPSSTLIHGITDADVAGQRFDDSRVHALAAGAALVIAHNARFDRPVVERRFPLFAELSWACSLQEIDWKTEGYGSGSLEFLAYRQGFFYEAHRAEMDCRALLQVLAGTDGRGTPYLKRLLDRSSGVDMRLWALNAPFDAKDALKLRGYRWHAAEPRAWTVTVSRDQARAEADWLYNQVYAGRPAVIRVDAINATTRFTSRVLKTYQMTLGPRTEPASQAME